MRKTIWSCWFQGREHAPEIVERCLSSWEDRNPGWEFRCLDGSTLYNYLDLDAFVDLSRQSITAASLSDLVRILLLHEYGGVWVDATTYCNIPLDDWVEQAAGTGFFAFTNSEPDRVIASWFLAAQSNNPLVGKWAQECVSFWAGKTRTDDYFWFHHLFGELCELDADVHEAWESVPKIPYDGPSSIERVGMNEPAEVRAVEIDWTTPVFKLSHRLGEKGLVPGSLVDHATRRHGQLRSKPDALTCRDDPVQIASLKVSTENLGDHIQVLAGHRLLNRFGFSWGPAIDRDDEIATPPITEGRKRGILLNGWFKTNPQEWPPHPDLIAIYLGFHIRLFQSASLLSEAALEHYRAHAPVGCRDRYTLGLLQSRDVEAFLSHCVSLLFPRRLPRPGSQSITFVVSRDEQLLSHLPADVGPYEFVSHYSGSNDFESNLEQAGRLLAIYSERAKLIVTTMLHCALPAVAMGIPVVVLYPLNDGDMHRSDRERFSSLSEMIRVFHVNDIARVDWNGYSADVSGIKLDLLDRFRTLSHRWGAPSPRMLGPIAPASSLPVPPREEMYRFVEHVERVRRLTKSDQPEAN